MSWAEPDPYTRMIRLLHAPLVTQSLVVAARLGLADLIADGPRTASELAARTGVQASALARVLEVLADAEVLHRFPGGAFGGTAMSETLRASVPRSLREWTRLWGLPQRLAAINDLEYSVRTGLPSFPHLFGVDWWEHLAAHPDQAAVFNGATGDMARGMHAAAARTVDLSDVRRVVDVGGGRGYLLSELLPRYPGMTAVLYDQPAVVAEATAVLDAAGVAGRVDVRGGDFFAEVPTGGDAYLLSMILHDWDDERAVRILSAIRQVLPPGGRVLVIDAVLPEGDRSHDGRLLDLVMLTLHGGHERTESQFAALFEKAGLRHVMTRAAHATTGVLVAVADDDPDPVRSWQVPAHSEEERERYRAAGLWRDMTIPAAFGEVADRYPDSPAVITAAGTQTYAELRRRSDAVATGLLAAGLRPGQAVILQVTNGPHVPELWYGLLTAGLLPVCTLAAHRRHEIEQIARHTRAVAHVVQADLPALDAFAFAEEIRGLVPAMRMLLTVGAQPGDPGLRIEDLAATDVSGGDTARLRRMADTTDLRSPAVFQLSGGTTGTAKVIPRMHPEYWYNAVATARWWDLGPTDRLAFALPLVHNAGVANALHAAHSVGAALVLSTPRPDDLLPLMAKQRATWFMSPPGVMRDYLAHPLFDAAFADVGTCVLTATTVPGSIFDDLDRRGVHVTQAFGMTEGLFLFTPRDAGQALRRGTVGVPISPLDEIRLLRPGSLAEVEPGGVGELCARGPYTVRGYLEAPERDAEAFTPDGFYRSGDLVRPVQFDDVTAYRIEGRVKDLINRGGEKVNAAEVEDLLLRHAAVAEVALVAMPDLRLGERACAFVVVAPGAEPPPLADLCAFLEVQGLARFKWPERVEYLPALPRTSIGKVYKKELRERLAHSMPDQSAP
jgi:2,3-dihydroxybenzoate-AMP ligase